MADYSDGLYELTRVLDETTGESIGGGLGGDHGYGQEYVNDVFEMHPFWWGDCTCGFDKKEALWEDEHGHAKDCYQTILHESCYVDWGASFDRKPGHGWKECTCEQDLCAEMGLTYPDGAAIHCTCTYDADYREWAKEVQHADDCFFTRPNFRHFKSGLEVWWYKYIGRSMESKNDVTYLEWLDILKECMLSVKEAE